MKIVRSVADIKRASGSSGFVPTMGALHEGHLSLIRAAKSECDHVTVSIFVNPLQFGPGEDYERYPRREDEDAQACEEAGADIVFMPDAKKFTTGQGTSVHVSGVSELYEGLIRPGHFDGVATIVAKLFNLVRADYAYFGLKDRQQCAVVAKMVHELNFPISLRLMPIIREPDGLAMSSRNAYLSAEQRAIAPKLYEILERCRLAVRHAKSTVQVTSSLEKWTQTLKDFGFDVDYLALVDETTFQPTVKVGVHAVLIVAAYLGATRLIDNIPVLGH